jgi:hypothetical protein
MLTQSPLKTKYTEGSLFAYYGEDSPILSVVRHDRILDESIDVRLLNQGFAKVSKWDKYAEKNLRDVLNTEAHQIMCDSRQKLLEKTKIKEGLYAALSAREIYELDFFDSLITAADNKRLINENVPEPGTGVYLLIPVYSGNGPSPRNMECVKINSRIPEKAAGNLFYSLIGTMMSSYGKIVPISHDLEATSGGTLCGINSYEVPNDFLHLAKEYKTLEIKLLGGK